MSFLWPTMLYALLAVPVVIVLYMRAQRRRRAVAASFYRFGGANRPNQRAPGFQRHVAPLLFLAGLVILLVALARPRAEINLPRVEGTVILVFDVSGSMAANDVEPTRMDAAKKVAEEFIQSQPETVQIGIVSFSEGGFAVERPTNDTNALLTALKRLKPQNGTSLGQGIIVALNTIALEANMESRAEAEAQGPESGGQPSDGAPQEGQTRRPLEAELINQLPEGAYPASVIVVLSDGENNQSIDPLVAAQAAADHDVRIDTLGFGTSAGTVLKLDGFSVHTALNEAVLRGIAQVAGGKYYYTQTEKNPKDVYANIAPRLVIKPETMEITSLLTGASILIFIFGAAFSILKFNRFP